MRTLIFLLGFSLFCEARNKTEERPHRRRRRKKKNGDDQDMDIYMVDGSHEIPDGHENFGTELDGEVFVGNEYHPKHAAHEVGHHQNYEGLDECDTPRHDEGHGKFTQNNPYFHFSCCLEGHGACDDTPIKLNQKKECQGTFQIKQNRFVFINKN